MIRSNPVGVANSRPRRADALIQREKERETNVLLRLHLLRCGHQTHSEILYIFATVKITNGGTTTILATVLLPGGSATCTVQCQPRVVSDFQCIWYTWGGTGGRQFDADEEAKQTVHTLVRENPKTCSDEIRKLVDVYKKCVELQGQYVSKQYSCYVHFTFFLVSTRITPSLF
jgi:hypothetical protein